MNQEEQFYAEAFSRNIGIFTKEQQERIKNSTIAIGGLGGGGGIHAYALARLGVMNFHIADIDVFNVINTNRQIGATVENMGRKKTDSIKEMIMSINPYAKVTIFDKGVTEETVDDFLKGVDVVVDGIDFFQITARRLMFMKAHEKGIYVVTAGPIGYGSALLVFDPKGMSFDKYTDIRDGMSREDMLVRFGIGVTPTLIQRSYFDPKSINWKTEKAPSLVIGTLLAANLVATEVCKILNGQFNRLRPAPKSLHFDPYLLKIRKVWIPFGNRNPIQIIKRVIMMKIFKARGTI